MAPFCDTSREKGTPGQTPARAWFLSFHLSQVPHILALNPYPWCQLHLGHTLTNARPSPPFHHLIGSVGQILDAALLNY